MRPQPLRNGPEGAIGADETTKTPDGNNCWGHSLKRTDPTCWVRVADASDLPPTNTPYGRPPGLRPVKWIPHGWYGGAALIRGLRRPESRLRCAAALILQGRRFLAWRIEKAQIRGCLARPFPAQVIRPSRGPGAVLNARGAPTHWWLTQFGDCGSDQVDHLLDRLVFPEAHHRPASLGQHCVVSPVSRLVALNFRRPKLRIGDGPRCMLWAAVPEASVHEYGQPESWEHHVRLAPQIGNRTSMLPEPQTGSVK